jgi:hypothetical protein
LEWKCENECTLLFIIFTTVGLVVVVALVVVVEMVVVEDESNVVVVMVVDVGTVAVDVISTEVVHELVSKKVVITVEASVLLSCIEVC